MNSSRSRILVVDDDPALPKLLRVGLSRWGYDVLCASHGAEGIEKYRAHEADIVAIITDVDMPIMGGLEFVRKLREAGYKGRVVIMSGRMAPHELRAFQDCQVSGFFSKPFDVGLLAAMLSGPLDRAER